MTEMPFKNVDTSEWSDVDVRLGNVKFGTHQAYRDNNGEMPVCLIADLVNENGNRRDDQLFSIGAGYKVIDGGAAVEHTNPKHNVGENLGFSRGSKGAVLLESLCANPPDIDRLVERGEKVGGPRTAAFWEGMVLHLVEEVVEFGKPDEHGKKKTFRQPVATALYGWDVEFPGVGEGSGTEAGDGEAVRTAEDFGLTDDTFGQLMDLARASKSYEDFVSDAYGLDCIAEPGVQAAVDDDVKGIWGMKDVPA